jgi:hypothetical protein
MMAQWRGGAILNVGSIAGLTGLAGNPAYVASKHAVNRISRVYWLPSNPNEVNTGDRDFGLRLAVGGPEPASGNNCRLFGADWSVICLRSLLWTLTRLPEM